MKTKTKFLLIIIILIFASSLITIFVGSLFKIQHWPMANNLILTGKIGGLVSTIMGTWLLIANSRKKDSDYPEMK